MLIQKGLKVIEISDADTFLDINIKPTEFDADHIFLRANANGKPKYIEQTIKDITYKAVQVADKIYIPDKIQTI